jgi:cytochrome b pre-mRNA-processing protein 3
MALFTNHAQERAAFALYGTAVAAARQPYFYAELAVPDTLDGRFDLVGIHVFLVIRRLRREAERQAGVVAQALFDAMFSDMDINLREIGVGDMVIGKRVRAMWEAFHGRCGAYESALQHQDDADLAAALARNVWRADADPNAVALARIIRAQDAALARQPAAALVGGAVRFLGAEQAAQ